MRFILQVYEIGMLYGYFCYPLAVHSPNFCCPLSTMILGTYISSFAFLLSWGLFPFVRLNTGGVFCKCVAATMPTVIAWFLLFSVLARFFTTYTVQQFTMSTCRVHVCIRQTYKIAKSKGWGVLSNNFKNIACLLYSCWCNIMFLKEWEAMAE